MQYDTGRSTGKSNLPVHCGRPECDFVAGNMQYVWLVSMFWLHAVKNFKSQQVQGRQYLNFAATICMLRLELTVSLHLCRKILRSLLSVMYVSLRLGVMCVIVGVHMWMVWVDLRHPYVYCTYSWPREWIIVSWNHSKVNWFTVYIMLCAQCYVKSLSPVWYPYRVFQINEQALHQKVLEMSVRRNSCG